MLLELLNHNLFMARSEAIEDYYSSMRLFNPLSDSTAAKLNPAILPTGSFQEKVLFMGGQLIRYRVRRGGGIIQIRESRIK